MTLHNIALTLIPGLGCKSIRQLLELGHTPESIFGLRHGELKEIFGRHDDIIQAIEGRTTFARAEEEILFMEKYGIDALFCTDEEYPSRLNLPGCEDTPVLIYRKGHCNLNVQHSLSVVGTRRATNHGRMATDRIISEFAESGLLIVSGLAYGIDTAAHTAAVSHGLPTVAVLGHGLDRIYPSQNRNLAKQIIDQGGALITEYMSRTEISPAYFPARNRIIAALGDATAVIEASKKGGALITANIANGYNRDVFAVPGRLSDTYSEGCNTLIATHRASLLRSAQDICDTMGWELASPSGGKSIQGELFPSLSTDEQAISDLLTARGELALDEMSVITEISIPKLASIMLSLELKDLVQCLPGHRYRRTV